MSEIIKVEPYMMKKGNRVGKAAIEFTDGVLKGFHMIGFTICDEEQKGIFVLFPASVQLVNKQEGKTRPFYFLRPNSPDLLDKLQDAILDVYDSMLENTRKGINRPRMKPAVESAAPVVVEQEEVKS